MASVDAHTAGKIAIVSLYCSAMVCLNHSYTISAPFSADAHLPFAALNHGVQDTIKFGLARVSTPFFFTLSAWLLFTRLGDSLKTWPSELGKRGRTLLVPYLFWAAASFALLMALQTVPAFAARSGRGTLVDQPWPEMLRVLLWSPVAHPLWFVRDLLFLVAAAPLVWLLMRWKPLAWVVLAALLAVWFRWFEVRDVRAVLFFCLGAYCALHRPSLVARGAWERCACAGAWFAVIGAQTVYIMRVGDETALLNNSAILLGLATLWSCADVAAPLARNRAVAWMAAFTFLIYIAHEPAVTLVRHAFFAALGKQDQLVLLASFVAIAALVITGIVAAGALTRRFTPWLYSVATGGRGAGSARQRTAVAAVAPAVAGPA